MAWIIKGETGKGMDATGRSMDELKIQNAQLSFRSLATDSLTWTAATTDATGAGTVVPSIGQVVELFSDTTRRFKGHVTKVKVSTRSVAVTVEGPWWWMLRTPLTSVQADATAVTAERASYIFPTQGLATSLQALADRAIANGVPMVRGTFAAMFTVPKISLAEMNCAAALAELLRWVPDAVVWFDYAGTTPTMRISRRGEMTALDLTLGTSAVETLDISPRLDLEVSRVELNFVDRNPTTGKPRWQSQVDGTSAAGKRQIITVSGPEIVDFLPKDDFESVKVINSLITSISNTYIADNDSFLASVKKEYGVQSGGLLGSWGYWSGTSPRKFVARSFSAPYAKSISGEPIPSTAKYWVTSAATLPEWAKKKLGAIEAELKGTWLAYWIKYAGTLTGWPDYFETLRSGAQTTSGFYTQSGNDMIHWLARSFTVRGYLVSVPYATLTEIYKPWDYDYLTPPAGLAASLRGAQNWVPWEGSVDLVDPFATGANLLAQKINIAGTLAECASMGALLSGMSYDLTRERTRYEIGAPARTDFGSLVSRIRREPKDNIIYL